jgi:DNA mismatch repair protein MSH6
MSLNEMVFGSSKAKSAAKTSPSSSSSSAAAPPAKKSKAAVSSESEADMDDEDDDEDDFIDDDDDDDISDIVGKKKGKKTSAKKSSPATAKSSSAGGKRKRGDDADGVDEDESEGDAGGGGSGGVVAAGQHLHNFLPFLQPDKRRDAKGRKPDDPGFNVRTLMIDPNWIKQQTPAKQQWWKFKAQNVDTVLFFRQGKFYELFNMDADVAVRELGCVYMKGQEAHAGFPEISYGTMSDRLVSLGYRVARVEQTETPEGLKERNASMMKGVKKDNVVRRDLCGIKSKGTRTCTHLDVYAGKQADDAVVAATEASGKASAGRDLAYGDTTAVSALLDHAHGGNAGTLLLAIRESVLNVQSSSSSSSSSDSFTHIGVAICDSLSGDVHVAEFVDDRNRSRLKTLITRFPPGEVLY